MKAKGYGITKQLVAVCAGLLLVFSAVAYIGYRLAARDATLGIFDFGIKWFASSFGLIIAIFGMPGMLGQWIMRGGGGNFAYRLTFAIFCSVVLTWYVLKRLDAFSLFF